MSARGAFLGFAVALSIVLPAGAAEVEVVDLTGGEPTSEVLIHALEIPADAPVDAIASVAILVPFDRAQLTDQARRTLDELVLAISSPALSDQHVQVEGYTDASGGKDLNQRLSQERAAAVYAYLVEKGIDPLRLSKVGFGEEVPMPGSDPNDARNRRIQVASWMAGVPATPAVAMQAQDLPIALAYQVHVTRPDGSHGLVDPSEGAFMTGDQVYLTFESSMTGFFDAYSVTGAEVIQLGSWMVDSAQNLRLPTAPDVIAFDGGAGTDLVVLQFYPCETARTRAAVDLAEDVLSTLPDCTDLAQRVFQGDRTRDLAVKSDDDGSGTMIVVPVDGVPAAALRGLSLAIPLAHR